MTPEGRVKENIKRVLRECGAYYHMPVQNGMGLPTLDFICCHYGRYFAVEAKAARGKVTDRQLLTMKQITDSGGVVFVVSNDEQLAELRDWLRSLQILA